MNQIRKIEQIIIFFSKNKNNNFNNKRNLKRGISSLRNNLGFHPLKKSSSASDLIILKNNLRYSSKIGKIDYSNDTLKLNKNKVGFNPNNFSANIYLKKIIKI